MLSHHLWIPACMHVAAWKQQCKLQHRSAERAMDQLILWPSFRTFKFAHSKFQTRIESATWLWWKMGAMTVHKEFMTLDCCSLHRCLFANLSWRVSHKHLSNFEFQTLMRMHIATTIALQDTPVDILFVYNTRELSSTFLDIMCASIIPLSIVWNNKVSFDSETHKLMLCKVNIT